MEVEKCPLCGGELVKVGSCSGCSGCKGRLSCQNCGWQDSAGRHGAITDGIINAFSRIKDWFISDRGEEKR